MTQVTPITSDFFPRGLSDAQATSIEGKIGAQTGQKQLFKDGFKAGGRARYGYLLKKIPRGRARKGGTKYNSKIEMNPPAFAIAREILETYSKGLKGSKAIANNLNERKIPGPSAWDSYGNLIVRCDTCKLTTFYADHDPLHIICKPCNELLIFPRDNLWSGGMVLSIVKDAEWTYSGHYRWNYFNSRIKHGKNSGKYTGGVFEDGEYFGKRHKPASEWQIKRDNHPAAIDSETCKRVIEKRERKLNRKPGERRRSNQHPYTVVCGVCGSLFSKRGDGY